MFRDFYRMADELHTAVKPLKRTAYLVRLDTALFSFRNGVQNSMTGMQFVNALAELARRTTVTTADVVAWFKKRRLT